MSEDSLPDVDLENVDHDLVQTHLAGEEYGEFEVLEEVEADTNPLDVRTDSEKTILCLTRGGDTIDVPDGTFEYQGEGNLVRTVISDEPTALGYYLYALETYIGGVDDEEPVLEAVSEKVDLSPYHSWLDGLSQADRRIRLIDLWEERIDNGDWLSEKYMDNWETEFRKTGLSGDSRRFAEEIAESAEKHPTMCYRVAQHAAMEYQDSERVDYVEGLVLPKQASHAVRHAWIEVDGHVAELTWPWHDIDGSEAVYQGVKIPIRVVAKQRQSRSSGGPAILTEEGLSLMRRTL